MLAFLFIVHFLTSVVARMESTGASDKATKTKLDRDFKQAKDNCKSIMAFFKRNSGVSDKGYQIMSADFNDALQKFSSLSTRIEKMKKDSGDSDTKNSSKYDDSSSSNSGFSDKNSTPNEGIMEEQQQMRLQFLQHDVEDLRKRKEDILQVERDVDEISEMFKDLQFMVAEQQESIDVIETNITQAKDKTQDAFAELKEAEDYQKKAREKQCWMLLCLMIVLGCIVLGVWQSLK
jgi:chromosome segregation ATPase